MYILVIFVSGEQREREREREGGRERERALHRQYELQFKSTITGKVCEIEYCNTKVRDSRTKLSYSVTESPVCMFQ